jgi:Amt family ammonium transporter
MTITGVVLVAAAVTAAAAAVAVVLVLAAAATAAGITWMIVSWIHRRPSLIGMVTGAVVGLVAVTPAAGFVPPLFGIPIGAIAAVIAYYAMIWRSKGKLDESLDVWACHGMGGTWGALATGIFASVAVNTLGANGAVFGNSLQVLKQLAAVGAVWGYAFGATWLIAKIVNRVVGLRVSREEETVGLDIAQHGERAYAGPLPG